MTSYPSYSLLAVSFCQCASLFYCTSLDFVCALWAISSGLVCQNDVGGVR